MIRRFRRSIGLLRQLYCNLVDEWYLFNNNSDRATLVADRSLGQLVEVIDGDRYGQFFGSEEEGCS